MTNDLKNELKKGGAARVFGGFAEMVLAVGRMVLIFASRGQVGFEYSEVERKLDESRATLRARQALLVERLTSMEFERALTQFRRFDVMNNELTPDHNDVGKPSVEMTVNMFRVVAESIRAGLVANIEFVLNETGETLLTDQMLSVDQEILLNINDDALRAMFDAVEVHVETPMDDDRFSYESLTVKRLQRSVAVLHKQAAEITGD